MSQRTWMAALGCVGMLLLGATPLQAESLEGVVRSVGSAVSAQVIITERGAPKGPALCRSDLTRKISRISGMTIKVDGEWMLHDKGPKKGEKRCLEAATFTVMKTSSGRDAVVGVLAKTDNGFQVTTAEGKVFTLSDAPGGLKKMAGKKVILDVKQFSSPNALDAGTKVVTYSEFPE